MPSRTRQHGLGGGSSRTADLAMLLVVVALAVAATASLAATFRSAATPDSPVLPDAHAKAAVLDLAAVLEACALAGGADPAAQRAQGACIDSLAADGVGDARIELAAPVVESARGTGAALPAAGSAAWAWRTPAGTLAAAAPAPASAAGDATPTWYVAVVGADGRMQVACGARVAADGSTSGATPACPTAPG